jgi:hypothetical protein
MVGAMLTRKFLFIVPILSSCLVGNLVPLLGGQITILHRDPGSPGSYSCSVSGLKGMGSDCGTTYDEMVFTAEILTIASDSNDEYRLTLRPKTIFKGTPTLGIEILTAQRKCLPAMKTGDSWLFSLYRDEVSKEFIVSYGTRSGPEAEESQQIDSLRRLASLDTAGVVKGRAYSDRDTSDGLRERPSVNHTIVVTRLEDGREFKALTNQQGEFEFDALPAGRYDLEPNTKPGIWTMWSGKFDVEPHGCTDFDLDFHVDGEISGRLLFPAGVDPSTWQVEVMPADDPGVVPVSAWTDDAGRFALHGLNPGRYILVFQKTDMRKGPNLRADLFAPGTPNRTNAQMISLGKATRIEGIELVVPLAAIK